MGCRWRMNGGTRRVCTSRQGAASNGTSFSHQTCSMSSTKKKVARQEVTESGRRVSAAKQSSFSRVMRAILVGAMKHSRQKAHFSVLMDEELHRRSLASCDRMHRVIVSPTSLYILAYPFTKTGAFIHRSKLPKSFSMGFCCFWWKHFANLVF